jgi:hypothetical protein
VWAKVCVATASGSGGDTAGAGVASCSPACDGAFAPRAVATRRCLRRFLGRRRLAASAPQRRHRMGSIRNRCCRSTEAQQEAEGTAAAGAGASASVPPSRGSLRAAPSGQACSRLTWTAAGRRLRRGRLSSLAVGAPSTSLLAPFLSSFSDSASEPLPSCPILPDWLSQAGARSLAAALASVHSPTTLAGGRPDQPGRPASLRSRCFHHLRLHGLPQALARADAE